MISSDLGDMFIQKGPFIAGQTMPFPADSNGHPILTASQFNALRDELIHLRGIRSNALALAEEYDRKERLISSVALARMLREWCE